MLYFTVSSKDSEPDAFTERQHMLHLIQMCLYADNTHNCLFHLTERTKKENLNFLHLKQANAMQSHHMMRCTFIKAVHKVYMYKHI